MADSGTLEWWPLDPTKWPHTPPLMVFRQLLNLDPQLVWRMGTGHLVNLLEEALDQPERAEKVLAQHWDKIISGVPVGECATCGRLWPCPTVKILTGEADG